MRKASPHIASISSLEHSKGLFHNLCGVQALRILSFGGAPRAVGATEANQISCTRLLRTKAVPENTKGKNLRSKPLAPPKPPSRLEQYFDRIKLKKGVQIPAKFDVSPHLPAFMSVLLMSHENAFVPPNEHCAFPSNLILEC
jgi:hypothetical protein